MTPRRLTVALLACSALAASSYPHLRGDNLMRAYAYEREAFALCGLAYLTGRLAQGWRPHGAQWAALVLAAGLTAQAFVGPWAWPAFAVARWDVGRAVSIATYAGVIVALAFARRL